MTKPDFQRLAGYVYGDFAELNAVHEKLRQSGAVAP